MSHLMHPGSDIWSDVSFSYPSTAASAKHVFIMSHSSRFWYDLWREELWNRSLFCIVATIADASMDPDLIHQTKGYKMALFVHTLFGEISWTFPTSSGLNLEQRN